MKTLVNVIRNLWTKFKIVSYWLAVIIIPVSGWFSFFWEKNQTKPKIKGEIIISTHGGGSGSKGKFNILSTYLLLTNKRDNITVLKQINLKFRYKNEKYEYPALYSFPEWPLAEPKNDSTMDVKIKDIKSHYIVSRNLIVKKGIPTCGFISFSLPSGQVNESLRKHDTEFQIEVIDIFDRKTTIKSKMSKTMDLDWFSSIFGVPVNIKKEYLESKIFYD